MTILAFVDTETTGLDADRHQVWEVGLILRGEDGTDRERRWLLPVDVLSADPAALDIGGFHDRHPQGLRWSSSDHGGMLARCDDFARVFADWTKGAHLVGAVVSFDEERLRRLLRRYDVEPGWHYHLVDVENLAAGWLMGADRGLGPADTDWTSIAQPPWDSEALSRALGVDPDNYERHTALGDARWARDLYDKVMGRP